MPELTQEEALDLLWTAKDYRNPEVFLWADLTQDTEMHEWNGTHPVEDNTTVRTAKAGATVLVTMVSRLGDVGIRDVRLNPPSHGYHARVLPESLTNWRRIPEDAPMDWKGPPIERAGRPEMSPGLVNLIVERPPNRKERRARKAGKRK